MVGPGVRLTAVVVVTLVVMTSAAATTGPRSWAQGAPPSATDAPLRVSPGSTTTGPIDQAVATSVALFDNGSATFGVLARDDNFPDALGGSALGFGVAPLLFTSSSGGIAAATLSEFQRVVQPGGTVYILGGTAAVPAEVDGQLQQAGFVPRRLAGSGRELTAVAVADEVIALHGRDGRPSLDTMILATSANWPDAVTAGQLGSYFGIPVLLTPTGALSDATREALTRYRPATVLVMGGTAAVSDGVAVDVAGITGQGSVVRLAGPTRTGTGAQIAAYARDLFAQLQEPLRYAVVVNLRRDDAFAHVLSASMLTGRLGGIFVPVEQTQGASYLTPDVAEGICRTDIGVLVAGGPDLVDDATAEQVQQALTGADCTPTSPTGGGTTPPPGEGTPPPPPPPPPADGTVAGLQDHEAVLVSGLAHALPARLQGSDGGLTYDAVVAASVQASGGQELVTTGTLVQQPDGSVTYSPEPTDRLRLELAGGRVLELFVSQMDGDFSSDRSSTFFNNPHVLAVRITEPAAGTDYELQSQFADGQEAVAVVGQFVDAEGGVTAQLDLAQQGTKQFGDSSFTHEYQVQGSVTTDRLSIEVTFSRRFELINTVLQDRGQFHTTWALGGSTYQLQDGAYSVILRDGNPVELERWAYGAVLTQDGTQIGQVELREELDGLAAYLVGPGGEVQINRWGSTA